MEQNINLKNLEKNTWTTILVVLVALTAFSRTNIFPRGLTVPIFISVFIFTLCFSIAFFLDFKRMYIYAFLITGAFILSEIIRANPGIIFETGYAYFIPAAVGIGIGTVYFIRFLKMYPLPADGPSNDI